MTAVAEQFPLLENRFFFFRAPGCPGSSYVLIKRGKNFSVTLIQANMGWIDVAFNLLCILKEWDFPGHREGIPKKKKKIGRQVYLTTECCQLVKMTFH